MQQYRKRLRKNPARHPRSLTDRRVLAKNDKAITVSSSFWSRSASGDAGVPEGGRASVSELDFYRRAWRRGERYVILQALACCLEERIPVPEWLLAAFHETFGRFANYECATLDEAFDAPVYGRWHRSEYGRRLPAYHRVAWYKRQGMTLEAAFEKVAEEERAEGYPVGAEAVKKWYYKFRRRFKSACEKAGLVWHGG